MFITVCIITLSIIEITSIGEYTEPRYFHTHVIGGQYLEHIGSEVEVFIDQIGLIDITIMEL
jgi:hypothetical protein